MHILVYDVAASTSGALSVLEDLYREVAELEDKSVQWTFVVSIPKLEETENIKVIRKPWVKKSWFHRLLFEYFGIQKVIKKIKPDKVVSMQNLTVPRCKLPQVLYVHLPFVFTDYKFSLKESKVLWIYQNILSRAVYRSIRRAKKTIVQTEWMKESCKTIANADDSKVVIVQPNVGEKNEKQFELKSENFKRFVYPATPFKYKNHILILQACELLKEEGIEDYEVIFTFTKENGKYASYLFDYAKGKGLNVIFGGSKPRKEIFDLYSKSVMIFPSYVESFGLPLLEARISGSPILAGKMPFCQEILEEYQNVMYYELEDAKTLAEYMKKCINDEFLYHKNGDCEIMIEKKIANEILN